MSTDRPTLTPDQLTVRQSTLVRERAALVRLAVDGHVTITTTAPTNLARLLRNTVEGRGYHLVTEPRPSSEGELRTGTVTAEATRTDGITLRERFLPGSVRLLVGLLAATAGLLAVALAATEFAIITLMLAGLAIASPYADSTTPATVSYPVQLDLSITSEPVGPDEAVDTTADPSLPTDSRFSGRPTPAAVTVDVVSYAPFEGVAEPALREDVAAILNALREFSDV